jgi:starch synthase
MSRKAQLAIIGTGEAQYEQSLTALAQKNPGKMVVRLAFDPALANRVYAGADAYLMPSKSEPCGLSQLIAMHFGTIPVVHATGGLNDTVKPYNPETGEGKGFTFQSYNGEDFMAAIDRSLDLYENNREAWNKLAANDMNLDVSWKVPAQAYMDMFRKVIG